MAKEIKVRQCCGICRFFTQYKGNPFEGECRRDATNPRLTGTRSCCEYFELLPYLEPERNLEDNMEKIEVRKCCGVCVYFLLKEGSATEGTCFADLQDARPVSAFDCCEKFRLPLYLDLSEEEPSFICYLYDLWELIEKCRGNSDAFRENLNKPARDVVIELLSKKLGFIHPDHFSSRYTAKDTLLSLAYKFSEDEFFSFLTGKMTWHEFLKKAFDKGIKPVIVKRQ